MAPLATYTQTTTIQEETLPKLDKCTLSETELNENLARKNAVPDSHPFGFPTPLKWGNIIGLTAIHLLAVYGLCTYPWMTGWRLVAYEFPIGIMAGFGVTAGVHRLWCHRAYKAKLPLRIFLMLCYTASGENSIVEWVKDHRVHHKYSETTADPHNSNRGFFFAHAGWLMMNKHPDVIRKGKQMDFSDLYEDPVVRFHEKYYWVLKALLAFIIPIAIPPLWWGESWYWSILANNVKYIVVLNMTWSVNSAAHIWGYKPYDKRINPAENKVVSFVAMGEGWHNYHHTFPWDYRASEMGYYLNGTTLTLDILAMLGQVYDQKKASKELVRKIAEKHGDGTVYECPPEEVASKTE